MAAARAGATACAHPVASERVDAVLVFFRLGRDLRRCPPKRAALKRWPKDGPLAGGAKAVLRLMKEGSQEDQMKATEAAQEELQKKVEEDAKEANTQWRAWVKKATEDLFAKQKQRGNRQLNIQG